MCQLNIDKDNFIRDLFEWFQENKRDLPWRKTYSPYHVWISEMMLQQTQMERGVQYFNRWIEEFSCPNDIAGASLERVLQLWEGLGYYSRARNIYHSALMIRDDFQGEIPCDAEKIRSLPGIGEYTLCALMGIAFEKDYAVIDANVERVFARLCNCTDKNLKKAIKPFVQALLPKGQARIYNQALMELGALVCKKNPLCELCPILGYCESRKLGLEKMRPVPKEKKAVIPVLASFCILENSGQKQLIRQRLPEHEFNTQKEQKLWLNMWEYIGIDNIFVEEKILPKDKEFLARQSLLIELAKLFGLEKECIDREISKQSICIRSNYTNHKLSAYYFRWQISGELERKIAGKVLESKYQWVESTKQYAMASHHRKVSGKAFGKSFGEKLL